MSDTVRFLTANDTGTPANSSGANGFPFPTVLGSTGPGTSNPARLTYQDAIKWWWRVNGWTFSSTWSMLGLDGHTYSFPSGPMILGGPTRELHLISPSLVISHSIGGASYGMTLPIQAPFFSQDPTHADADVWPNIQLSSGPNGGLGVGFLVSGEITFAFNSSFLSNVTGTFIATLDGYPVTMYYDATTAPPTSYTVGNMIFTPSSFWAYASLANGSPIYNTSTGAQLQSPTN